MADTTETDRSAATRARLMDAAREAFAAKGFHATTTRDIAAAAGMSPAALYIHHKSKEELLYLISKAGHELVLQLVRDAVASSSDRVEQLRTVVRSWVDYHLRDYTMARIVNYELSALTPPHQDEITALRRSAVQEVEAIVRAGVRSGAFTTRQPALATTAILSLAVDTSRWFPESAWKRKQVTDYYATLALLIVGAKA
ncbi:TetR/AcrR family transcriptional regulator [Nostocoides japonicum]|nr:TetR/AcrR family transcriptional regulator [Tetrasphaera japonica]